MKMQKKDILVSANTVIAVLKERAEDAVKAGHLHRCSSLHEAIIVIENLKHKPKKELGQKLLDEG